MKNLLKSTPQPEAISVYNLLTKRADSPFELLYQLQGMGYTLGRALQSYEPLENNCMEDHQQSLEMHVEVMRLWIDKALEQFTNALDAIPAPPEQA